jgi:hypothetical protein
MSTKWMFLAPIVWFLLCQQRYSTNTTYIIDIQVNRSVVNDNSFYFIYISIKYICSIMIILRNDNIMLQNKSQMHYKSVRKENPSFYNLFFFCPCIFHFLILSFLLHILDLQYISTIITVWVNLTTLHTYMYNIVWRNFSWKPLYTTFGEKVSKIYLSIKTMIEN